MPRPAQCPAHIYRLILSCWQEDPHERPSFEDLLVSVRDLSPTKKTFKTSALQIISSIKENQDYANPSPHPGRRVSMPVGSGHASGGGPLPEREDSVRSVFGYTAFPSFAEPPTPGDGPAGYMAGERGGATWPNGQGGDSNSNALDADESEYTELDAGSEVDAAALETARRVVDEAVVAQTKRSQNSMGYGKRLSLEPARTSSPPGLPGMQEVPEEGGPAPTRLLPVQEGPGAATPTPTPTALSTQEGEDTEASIAFPAHGAGAAATAVAGVPGSVAPGRSPGSKHSSRLLVPKSLRATANATAPSGALETFV